MSSLSSMTYADTKITPMHIKHFVLRFLNFPKRGARKQRNVEYPSSKILHWSTTLSILHFFTGYDGLARLLLSKGASVDVISSKGTALHLAASSWKSGIMKILLEHNADVMGYLMFLSAQLLVYKVLLSTTWLTFSF